MIRQNVIKEETDRLVKSGGKLINVLSKNGKLLSTKSTGLPRKIAKRIARQKEVQRDGYNPGQLGASTVAGSLSRRKRRQNLADFTPKYNGNSPKTFEEYYGIGNERFNNKYIEIKEVKI